jgi:hypothetical protein
MPDIATATEMNVGSQPVSEVWLGSNLVWPKFVTPKSIPGLYAWYDATQGLYSATSGGSLVTANGAAVARWEDQSGNGRHLLQSNATYQPKVLASGLNGKNVVDFTSDVLVSNAANWGMGQNKVFIFYVLKWDTQPDYATLMRLSDDSPGAFILQNWWDGSSYAFRPGFWTNGIYRFPVATSTIGTAWQSQYVLFPRASSFQAELYKNNTQIASISATDNNINFASNRYFGLGAEITTSGTLGSPADFFDGKIAELCIYMTPRAVTARDVTNLTNYFAAKWGV